MNITLSADKKTISNSRRYAKEHGTSLNSLIRDYLKKISGESDHKTNAQEFSQLAKSMAGRSEPGFRFNRDAMHNRDSTA